MLPLQLQLALRCSAPLSVRLRADAVAREEGGGSLGRSFALGERWQVQRLSRRLLEGDSVFALAWLRASLFSLCVNQGAERLQRRAVNL